MWVSWMRCLNPMRRACKTFTISSALFSLMLLASGSGVVSFLLRLAGWLAATSWITLSFLKVSFRGCTADSLGGVSRGVSFSGFFRMDLGGVFCSSLVSFAFTFSLASAFWARWALFNSFSDNLFFAIGTKAAGVFTNNRYWGSISETSA